MEVTLTNITNLVQAIRAGQSVLPMREGHINYETGWRATKIPSKVTTIDPVKLGRSTTYPIQ